MPFTPTILESFRKKKELDGAKGLWFFHAPFALPSSYYAYLYEWECYIPFLVFLYLNFCLIL
jgi:hypothetical protein